MKQSLQARGPAPAPDNQALASSLAGPSGLLRHLVLVLLILLELLLLVCQWLKVMLLESIVLGLLVLVVLGLLVLGALDLLLMELLEQILGLLRELEQLLLRTWELGMLRRGGLEQLRLLWRLVVGSKRIRKVWLSRLERLGIRVQLLPLLIQVALDLRLVAHRDAVIDLQ